MIENKIDVDSYVSRNTLESLGLKNYDVLEEKPYIKIYHLDNYNKARYFYKMDELLIAPVFRIALAVNWASVKFNPTIEPTYKITRDLIEKLLSPYDNETNRWIYSLNLKSFDQLMKVTDDLKWIDEKLSHLLNLLNENGNTAIPESLAEIINYLNRAYSMTGNLTNSSTEIDQDSIITRFTKNSNKLLTQIASQFLMDLNNAVANTNNFRIELARETEEYKQLLNEHINLERNELISISLRSAVKPYYDEELSVTLLKNQKPSSLLYDKVKFAELDEPKENDSFEQSGFKEKNNTQDNGKTQNTIDLDHGIVGKGFNGQSTNNFTDKKLNDTNLPSDDALKLDFGNTDELF